MKWLMFFLFSISLFAQPDSNWTPILGRTQIHDKFIYYENGDTVLQAVLLGNIGTTDNALDVSIQDQTTDAVIAYFNQVHNSTTLSAQANIDSTFIEVDDATGIVIGSYLLMFDSLSSRFTTCFATGINGTTIDIDCPMDFDYPIGTNVDIAIVDLSVDGSGTTQVFGLRGLSPSPVGTAFDITRIMFQCKTENPVSFGLFADQPILDNGLFLRMRDGRFKNILNFKSNDDMALAMFDFTILQAINPAQGADGFQGRLTFAGQNKIGVVIRVRPGEDLEFWVQDDLSAITTLRIIAEGHQVSE